MPIPVICPGCKASFRVSDKFAGKQGPCPKCKTVIQIPEAGAIPATDDIKIHAPEEHVSGGKTTTGKLITKPIRRKEPRLRPLPSAIAGGVAVAVIVVGRLAGDMFVTQFALRAVGLVLLGVPIAVLGYAFLRNDELEPYRGRELWIRAAVCALVYAGLWGVFGFVPADMHEEFWQWAVIAAPFLIGGATAAFASLEFDFATGFFHYCFYLMATLALRWIIGMPAIWSVTSIAAS